MPSKSPDAIIVLPNPATGRAKRRLYDAVVLDFIAAGLRVHRLEATARPSVIPSAKGRWQQLASAYRKVFHCRRSSSILYLPFPNYILLPLFAAFMGVSVVYHLQEEKSSLRRWLNWRCLLRPCARHIVYISEASMANYPPEGISYSLLGPTLDRKAAARLSSPNNPERAFPFTLLLVLENPSAAVLDRYLSLALSLPGMQFLLLAGSNIDTDSLQDPFPSNLEYSIRPYTRKRYFQQAHLLVQLDGEAQGLAWTNELCLESFSYDLPVIALSDRPYAHCLIKDGYNGFIFPSGRLDRLRQKILELSMDRETYLQLAEEARKAALLQTVEAAIGRVMADMGLETPKEDPFFKPTFE